MKQTAVAFEAKMRRAGSALDRNNTGRADSTQEERAREMKKASAGEERTRYEGGVHGGSQSGRMCNLSVSGASGLIFHAVVRGAIPTARPWFPQREKERSLLLRGPRRVSC